jgi:hypothetical protein
MSNWRNTHPWCRPGANHSSVVAPEPCRARFDEVGILLDFGEIWLVTNEEKTSLKAACLQAATTLIAARDSMKGAVDLDECVKLAAELYCRRPQPAQHANVVDQAPPFAPEP